jgi:geranylgeranyl pyrophosphate synthase
MVSEHGLVLGHFPLPVGTVGHCGEAENQGDSPARQASEQERLAVASIYRPIEHQMVQVEERLDQVIGNAPPHIAGELAHALKGGGKRLRPALTLLAGSFHNGGSESVIYAATAIELLHTATLVHDDSIDHALLRRGRLTVNRLWGNHDAVFLGDYLCAASAHMAAETGNVQAMAVFARTLSDLCRGAIGEHTAQHHHCRDEYFLTIGGKTAALFRAATESGALLSGAPKKMVRWLRDYGYNLGMAFQIVDDIHDVASDLARGILNLPALLVLEGSGGSDVAQMLERDRENGLRAITHMAGSPAVLEECRQMARSFGHRACAALEPLPRSAAYESLMSLAEYLTERQG